jgi:hypothetical protein
MQQRQQEALGSSPFVDCRADADGALGLSLPVKGELNLALLPCRQARRADKDVNRSNEQ